MLFHRFLTSILSVSLIVAPLKMACLPGCFKDFLFIFSQQFYTAVPPYPRFHFLCFQLPVMNHGPKILNENSRNKQVINFKLCTVLILFCPSQDVNHSLCLVSPCCKHPLPISHLVAFAVIRSTVTVSHCLCLTLILLNNGPKRKTGNAGNSDVPKEGPKMLPLSEKVSAV